MRFLALLLILGCGSCGAETAALPRAPESPPAAETPTMEISPAVDLQEGAQRTRFDGRQVFTIDCDGYWHTWVNCPVLGLLMPYGHVIPLTLRGGVLLEGGQPFRTRHACPDCVRA